MRFYAIFVPFLCGQVSSFIFPLRPKQIRSLSPLHVKDLERDIEERSRRNAKVGAGEVAAGAVLGGLIGGPFGMCLPCYESGLDHDRVSHATILSPIDIKEPYSGPRLDPIWGPRVHWKEPAKKRWSGWASPKRCCNRLGMSG